MARTLRVLLAGVRQEHAQRPVLEPPVGDGVPVALGLVHRADERLAGVLHQRHAPAVALQAGPDVFHQPLRSGGDLPPRVALPATSTQPLNTWTRLPPPGRNLDAELGALVHEGGLAA